MSYLVVVAPLKAGMAERARELLAEGPPFDLEDSVFVRHAVHLTDREAVFVFEGEGPSSTFALSAEDPTIWRAAEAWQECFAERPRMARTAYSWERGNPSRKSPSRPRQDRATAKAATFSLPERRAN